MGGADKLFALERDQMNPAKPHVVVAGAGIAGMAAAMTLAEAGVRVTLCDAAPEGGGKAKSLRDADGHPIEHSMRIYLDYYQTLLTLCSRVPTENGSTVLDNLVGVSAIRVTGRGVIGHPAAPVPLLRRRRTPARILGKVVQPLQQLARIVVRSALVVPGLARMGVPPMDTIHYLRAHLRLLGMCRDRLLAELGDISYGDFLQLSHRSIQAQEFFAALPRLFVAARPSAEAAAIAPIILKALFHLTNCPAALRDIKLPSVMMMNGPTSERMVEPWISYLQNLGVEVHFDMRVEDVEFENGRVTTLVLTDGSRMPCDYAILAIPYLALRDMATKDNVAQHVPHLTGPHAIALESSNGIQCFLRDIPSAWPSFMRPGIPASHIESEWSLVSVIQGAGFWRDVQLPEGTKFVLSMTWSDVDKPGRIFHRPLSQCNPEEIVTECLAQCGLERSEILGWRIDYELQYLSESDYLAATLPPHLAYPPAAGTHMVNLSPLTILMPGARLRSPRVCTEVPNLYLAGEATYSPNLTFFVPTMEKAASSGYLAAQEILNNAIPDHRPQIDIRDPLPFAALRRVDQWMWNRRARSSLASSDGPRAAVSHQK
ncbi:FAD-dependent oxidoreductase [Mycobacterium simiae]|uniref:FAD-dependent oxidoreductase n=1 Tax=Mycobacterium simiae TaxID=1784 RepID=A0A5B1BRU9_MYCSI|nr:FAD-dependent oxidoreductase [Mycobacterium simiae]KAA1250140.1 FAD-dependent oxidoreductase [Mycobacterium simiae]